MAASRPEPEPPAEPARSVEAAMGSSHGLHARPATAFVELAKDVRRRAWSCATAQRTANGKSLAALLDARRRGGRQR